MSTVHEAKSMQSFLFDPTHAVTLAWARAPALRLSRATAVAQTRRCPRRLPRLGIRQRLAL